VGKYDRAGNGLYGRTWPIGDRRKAAYQAPGRRHRVLPQAEQSRVRVLAAGSLEERLSLLHAAASEVLPFVAECGETLVPLRSAVQGRARFQKFDANAGNPDVSMSCHVAAYISCHGILRNQDVITRFIVSVSSTANLSEVAEVLAGPDPDNDGLVRSGIGQDERGTRIARRTDRAEYGGVRHLGHAAALERNRPPRLY
jgi:hypothetical protein